MHLLTNVYILLDQTSDSTYALCTGKQTAAAVKSMKASRLDKPDIIDIWFLYILFGVVFAPGHLQRSYPRGMGWMEMPASDIQLAKGYISPSARGCPTTYQSLSAYHYRTSAALLTSTPCVRQIQRQPWRRSGAVLPQKKMTNRMPFPVILYLIAWKWHLVPDKRVLVIHCLIFFLLISKGQCYTNTVFALCKSPRCWLQNTAQLATMKAYGTNWSPFFGDALSDIFLKLLTVTVVFPTTGLLHCVPLKFTTISITTCRYNHRYVIVHAAIAHGAIWECPKILMCD